MYSSIGKFDFSKKLRPKKRKESVGPETEKRAPGAVNFKNNFWRPIAAVLTMAAVYTPDSHPINPLTSQNSRFERAINNENPLTSSFPQLVYANYVDDDQTLTKQEPLRKQEDPSQKELEIIITKMLTRPDLFSDRVRNDVSLYYPIYKEVSDSYGIKWYLLWILHEAESKTSTDPNAFNGASGNVGAFQRSPGWPQSKVDQAAVGLEKLAIFPQRNPTDWKEAAFAAWHLTTIKSQDSILGSLISYGGEASKRYNLYKLCEQIFD